MIIAKIIFWSIVFLILHTYIFYPIILFILPKRKRKMDTAAASPLPRVSILISVYNEERIVRQRIENLLALDYPRENVEILIGSDGSSDATNDIAHAFAGQGVVLSAFSERRGKASVLNDLVQSSKNEILIFSDANTFYDPLVVQRMVRHFSDPSVGGVCGYLELRSEEHNSGGKGESFYWEYENAIKEMEGDVCTTFGATGAVYAIRRVLFVPLPTEMAINDDFMIPIKSVEQGFRIVYDKEVHAWEDATESAEKEFKRKIRIGAYNYHVLGQIIHLLNPKLGFIAFGLFSHKVIRWLVPFFMCVLFLLSVLLSDDMPIYRLFLWAQMAFYGAAVIGYVLDKLSYPVKVFTLPYYFVLANLGLLIGFFRYICKTQKPTWSATR